MKLEVLYEFWNTTVNSEKQLITWLNEAGVETINANVLDADNSHSIHDTIILKQEAVDVTEKLDQPSEDLSTDAKSYILQQQQLPYEPPGFDFQNDFTNAQVGPQAVIDYLFFCCSLTGAFVCSIARKVWGKLLE